MVTIAGSGEIEPALNRRLNDYLHRTSRAPAFGFGSIANSRANSLRTTAHCRQMF